MVGILLALFIIFSPSLSFAAITLNVSPADGSSSLKLEQAYLGLDNKKDVRLRVTSTDGKRYQVFARLLEPMVNEKGESLDLHAVSLATVSNSNTSGTLYSQNEERLSMGEQMLYSSGQNGESDSFTIAYALNPNEVKTSGNYSGRMVYTARSSDGGDSQATLTMNVQATPRWKATVGGSKSSDKIVINDKDVTEKTADYVKIAFSGNLGSEVRVYQQAVALPQSADGTELGSDGLMFYATGQAEGIKAQDVSVLTQSRSLLYQGTISDNAVLVYYQLNPKSLGDQAPGTYTGRLRFTIETEAGAQDYFIDVQCQIQPIFTIDVAVPTDGISFEHVIAKDPAQEKEVVVTVHTNLRKPYQVAQNLQTPMTNEKGLQISKDYFTQKVDLSQGSKGRTKYTDYLPVEAGEYPIFESDSRGGSSVFKITYKLQGYQGMSTGRFNAPIQYSLNQN